MESKKRIRIFIIVGTRPNFIKVTQFKNYAAESKDLEIQIIHTGQHYDEKMADVFFRQFNLKPDHRLNISPGSANRQIAEIMIRLEELCEKIGRPDILLVPGDVNSTLAGALFANKNGIRLGHIEAGLRSFDDAMPEEFNRILTDKMSDVFFVTEPSAVVHLKSEGVNESKIHFVGNTMIDTMVAFEHQIANSSILDELQIGENPFVLMTMHRPATVDSKNKFEKLVVLIDEISKKYKIVFPIHPRTIKNSKEFGLYETITLNKNLICTEPLDYFAFQKLIKESAFIITDSGGIQEESTYRQKPCLTLRPNTERPITVTKGTNTLLTFEINDIMTSILQIEKGSYKKGEIPELWDGKATLRILDVLQRTM